MNACRLLSLKSKSVPLRLHSSCLYILGGELDLVVMFEALIDVRSKWYDIGLYLKVSKGTLDAIKSQFGDPREQLREMLSEWLKTYPYPSWKLLIEALRSPIVGENHQADTLEQLYLSPGIAIVRM